MGDGTDESRARMIAGFDWHWRFVDELFAMDEIETGLVMQGIAVDGRRCARRSTRRSRRRSPRPGWRFPSCPTPSAAGGLGIPACISGIFWRRCSTCRAPIPTRCGDPRRARGAGDHGRARVGSRSRNSGGVEVIELGIVRGVRRDPPAVLITPTYTGCPATLVIEQSVRAALDEAGFGAVPVETVRSPPWTTDWIGEAGREKLLAYGIAPPSPRERTSSPARSADRSRPSRSAGSGRPRARRCGAAPIASSRSTGSNVIRKLDVRRFPLAKDHRGAARDRRCDFAAVRGA